MNRYTKPQVTQVVRDQLPEDHPQRSVEVDQLCGLWWVTKRSDTGFQLTENGHGAMMAAGISHHDLAWDLSDRKHILSPQRELNNRIHCPFHATFKGKQAVVRLYDERLAQWIELAGGLQKYLDRAVHTI